MSHNGRLIRWFNLIAVPVIAAAAILGPTCVSAQVEGDLREISCHVAQQSIEGLNAQRAVAVELGIPITFEIPPLPPECRP
jgi:hypothetical protein